MILWWNVGILILYNCVHSPMSSPLYRRGLSIYALLCVSIKQKQYGKNAWGILLPGAGEIPLVRVIDAVLADICPWKCSQTSIRYLPRTSTPYRKHKGGTATKQYCAETPHQGIPYPPTPLHQISRTACRMEGRTGMPCNPNHDLFHLIGNVYIWCI